MPQTDKTVQAKTLRFSKKPEALEQTEREHRKRVPGRQGRGDVLFLGLSVACTGE